MPEPLPKLRLIPDAVHADVMGDEALVLSFETGKYYTIRGTGADIIAALAEGPVDPADVHAALVKAYPGVPHLDDELTRFFEELLRERIVQRAFSEKKVDVVFEGAFGFQPLEVEAGLADILTLDPIHGVGREGWPQRR